MEIVNHQLKNGLNLLIGVARVMGKSVVLIVSVRVHDSKIVMDLPIHLARGSGERDKLMLQRYGSGGIP